MINPDEVADGGMSQPPAGNYQTMIVQNYCFGLEEKLRALQGREEARGFVDETCAVFYRQCESEIVQEYMKKYINDMLIRVWGHH